MRLRPRAAGPPLLAAAMLLTVEVTGRRALLFPEAVALSYGIWTLRRAAWARPLPLAAVPTGCALVGTACAWGPGPRWAWVAVAVAAAVAILHLTRSPLIPAVSAAVLPVVFGIRDPVYPAAVLGWCALIAVTTARSDRPPSAPWPGGRLAAFTAGAAVWVVAAGVLGAPALAAAPPLIVAGLEFTVRGGSPWSWPAARRVLLMVAAGALGAGALAAGGPAPVAGALAVAVVMGLAALLREPLTPAAALALVPFVAGTPDPLTVAAAFAVGGTALTIIGGAAARVHFPGA